MTDRVDTLIAVIRRDLETRGFSKDNINHFLIGYLGQFLRQSVNASSEIREQVEWRIRQNTSTDIRGTLDAGGVLGQPG